jgi:hypothetical protein
MTYGATENDPEIGIEGEISGAGLPATNQQSALLKPSFSFRAGVRPGGIVRQLVT